ncbi:MAG TPA: papain-like cysteine protease family protein [Dyella sp.]|uniref:papain-like cysteine protease family protein n=1 Tax=Dyella sp. TaxID=1869338 RepID=UPI002F92715D
MPTLQHFPIAQQAAVNSCWACVARCIINWYNGLGEANGQSYASDQALATAWQTATGQNQNGNINIQQSAAGALISLGFLAEIDDHAIPTPAEIGDSINNNHPLLAMLGTTEPDPDPNPDYQAGHWVVIVGIEEAAEDSDGDTNMDGNSDDDMDEEAFILSVFDPNDGQIHQVDYDAATYENGVWWQNTSYVDPYAAPAAD